jgi:transposase
VEVAGLYCDDSGRPGIDPEVAVRLMLAGFLLGIVHDRRLLREAQVNIAIRWFAGYGLHEALPDHSSLTRIRQRWGVDRSGASSSVRCGLASMPRSPPARSFILMPR